MTLRKDHTTDKSMAQDATGSSQTQLNIHLSGTAIAVLVAASIIILAGAVMLGLDIAERASERRESDRQSTSLQSAISKQGADLQRAWIANTEQLQRDWFMDANQLQRSWEKETARQVDKMHELQIQYRMTELKYDDVAVTLHRAGLVLPGDYTRGPQGNLDAESFKQEKRK
jgi:type III secretory pathway component EscR